MLTCDIQEALLSSPVCAPLDVTNRIPRCQNLLNKLLLVKALKW